LARLSRRSAKEGRQGQLGFLKHEMIDLGKLLMLDREERTSSHNFDARFFAASNDLMCRFPLHSHAADKGKVSPSQVFAGQLGHVDVDQALRPARRQHRGDCQQAQRWRGGVSAHEPQRVFEAPERVRKLGIDQ
jgi:hypothetical protein